MLCLVYSEGVQEIQVARVNDIARDHREALLIITIFLIVTFLCFDCLLVLVGN